MWLTRLTHPALGMAPLWCLTWMPRWLASNPEDTQTLNRGITSPPSNYSRWGELIEEVARHFHDSYGVDVVGEWMFEVWNEPNIVFWTGEPKMETYFRLFKETSDALSRVSSR